MTTSTASNVAVVGPGAIGTAVTAALHQVGRAPRLYGRTARDQLALHTPTGEIVVPGPVRVEVTEDVTPIDLVFLAVKSTQVEAAPPWLIALCRPHTVVCVLQNGVEQEAIVAAHAPRCQVLPSIVWFPAQAQADGSVWLRAEARLTVPDIQPGRAVSEALSRSLCTVELATDFSSMAWRKLMQNALAGLMALTGRRVGMFASADIAELGLAYLRECLAVARAEGADLDDTVPREIVDSFRAYPADMGTSILADREAGRPLEWDVRNGVVQRRGRQHGIPTPVSDLVVPLLAAVSDGPG
ncbi:oxidoreductase [Amycolatopsis sp. NBC_01480]|uniref:oxidoreductase n=1 Tax=Amycolatopsis sp. NBC_01480 TaxID=2903562 RepID=UPI002E28ADC0|nr:oxidoreductase [Amycolatopsis sp. NBC_01480]